MTTKKQLHLKPVPKALDGEFEYTPDEIKAIGPAAFKILLNDQDPSKDHIRWISSELFSQKGRARNQLKKLINTLDSRSILGLVLHPALGPCKDGIINRSRATTFGWCHQDFLRMNPEHALLAAQGLARRFLSQKHLGNSSLHTQRARCEIWAKHCEAFFLATPGWSQNLGPLITKGGTQRLWSLSRTFGEGFQTPQSLSEACLSALNSVLLKPLQWQDLYDEHCERLFSMARLDLKAWQGVINGIQTLNTSKPDLKILTPLLLLGYGRCLTEAILESTQVDGQYLHTLTHEAIVKIQKNYKSHTHDMTRWVGPVLRSTHWSGFETEREKIKNMMATLSIDKKDLQFYMRIRGQSGPPSKTEETTAITAFGANTWAQITKQWLGVSSSIKQDTEGPESRVKKNRI